MDVVARAGPDGLRRAMITHLQGLLARMDPSGPSVEMEVRGVRYEVLVPLFLWPELEAMRPDPALPSPEAGLHIFYHATQNQPVPVLVGFLRRPERDFFRKFTTVEGIGPAKAVRAMNVSVSVIARAIEQEDRAALTRLPGIGVRAADKIIATLRGKVVAEAALQDGQIATPVDLAVGDSRRVVADAIETVVTLGYPRAEAKRWVDAALQADPSLASVEEITMAVLRTRGS